MAEDIKTPITDAEVESVSGGAGDWRRYANGTYVNNGNYIVYTIAPGDVLSGIAMRVDSIYAGHKIVIYPRIWR